MFLSRLPYVACAYVMCLIKNLLTYLLTYFSPLATRAVRQLEG